jgi:hypothetical protein
VLVPHGHRDDAMHLGFAHVVGLLPDLRAVERA